MKTFINKHKLLLLTLLVLSIASCEKYENTEQLVPLTVDQDETLPSIRVNGTLLHSETFGNPTHPMLVLIHGGPGADYRSILKAKDFSNDGFYVVFYDQRGSGLSQRHYEDEDVFDVQTFVDDLEAVIEYYRNSSEQKIILMGHSWGGMLAAEFVNQYPEKADGLVIMEAGGLTYDDMLVYVNAWMKYDLTNEDVNDIVYQDQFITGSEHDILDYKAAVHPNLDEKVGNPGHTPFWRMGAVCSSAMQSYASENPFDFTTNLNQYTNKVLFAYSELNPAYGKEHAEIVAAPFPNVEIVEVPNCGHEIIEFAWEDFYSIALPFLEQYK